VAKNLTDSELEELRDLVDAIASRLGKSNYQMLSTAKHGSRLSPTNSVQLIVDQEIAHIKRIRELLGLPVRADRAPRAGLQPVAGVEPLREQLVRKGVEPDTYRYVREAKEKRAGKRSHSPPGPETRSGPAT
jgi:hypothetical protein